MHTTYEIRTFRTPITMRNGTEVSLVTEVTVRSDGCDLRFSHTGQGSRETGPWFSDSLSWSDCIEGALANIRAMASHIHASEMLVVWNEDLVG